MSRYNYEGSEQFKPISAWGYIGYAILFSIPIVGQIVLIVFSFSDKNINRRNYARSYFCVLLVALIVSLLIGVSSGVYRGGSLKSTVDAVISNVQRTIQRYIGKTPVGMAQNASSEVSRLLLLSEDTMVDVTVGGVPLQIRQSFKTAMDEYEDFFNGYFDAIDSGNVVKLTAVMAKYAATLEAFDKLDEEDLTESELAYYTEVHTRILQRIAGTTAAKAS